MSPSVYFHHFGHHLATRWQATTTLYQRIAAFIYIKAWRLIRVSSIVRMKLEGGRPKPYIEIFISPDVPVKFSFKKQRALIYINLMILYLVVYNLMEKMIFILLSKTQWTFQCLGKKIVRYACVNWKYFTLNELKKLR